MKDWKDWFLSKLYIHVDRQDLNIPNGIIKDLTTSEDMYQAFLARMIDEGYGEVYLSDGLWIGETIFEGTKSECENMLKKVSGPCSEYRNLEIHNCVRDELVEKAYSDLLEGLIDDAEFDKFMNKYCA